MTQKKHAGWVAWFARNPVAANLLMAILLVVGGLTVMDMRTEGFPAEAPRLVTVDVGFEGGSPEDVEEAVAVKIENALNGVAGIDKITSTVTADAANIVVLADVGYPVSTLKDDVKIRVDAISTFPAQVETIVITEEQEEDHIIHVQLSGDIAHNDLKETARRVRERLLDLPGVNKVVANGERAYEVNIELHEERLREYGLSFAEVAAAVQNASLNMSAGSLKTSGGTITLQADQQRYRGNDFENIIIRRSADGGMLRLQDVAVIRDGYAEQEIVSLFQGQVSINLDVQLIGRSSITEASEAVQTLVGEIQQENWIPAAIEIVTWDDEADEIRSRLGLLSKNALIGMGLVLIMLSLFLHVKVAFWVAIGIPISFAGALIVMGLPFLDYSLNDLTTFAFIIVLGIVVDDAIVIGESVFTYKRREGGGVETAIRGAMAVATPATFGVLTTVAAFYPLTMMKGDFGGPFRIIAVVTIFCLLFSLVESKLILPAHLAELDLDKNERSQGRWGKFQGRIEQALQNFVKTYYKPLIEIAVRYRYQSLGVFLSIFILAGGLVTSGVVRTVFFSDWQADVVYANATMDSGVPASRTHQVGEVISRSLKLVNDDIKKQYGMEKDPVLYTYLISADDQNVSLSVQLMPGSERDFLTTSFLNMWRNKVGELQGVKQLSFYAGFDDDNDVRIEMSSIDNAALKHAMIELKSHVQSYEGVHDIKTNLDNHTVELDVRLKPEAEALGLTYRDVIQQLRYAVFGFDVQRIQRDDEEVRVKVRYPKNARDDLGDLQNIRIRTPDGGTVPLSVVVAFISNKKQTQIDRIDGDRVLVLTGRLDKSRISATEITAGLEQKVFPLLLEKYPSVNINFAGEIEEEGKATEKLAAGFVMGLLMIYALLAVPLKSYTKPFVIMLAIPFGIIGAIIGHMIIGIPLSLLSFFGILALSGVVVNDSLVLVSSYNQIRDTGLSYEEAVVRAGMSRFRAVLLTSITTFVGLFPLILEKSEQAQMLIPMAVSLAFGILFATVITLFIIPVLLGIRRDIATYFQGQRVEPAIPVEGK